MGSTSVAYRSNASASGVAISLGASLASDPALALLAVSPPGPPCGSVGLSVLAAPAPARLRARHADAAPGRAGAFWLSRCVPAARHGPAEQAWWPAPGAVRR